MLARFNAPRSSALTARRSALCYVSLPPPALGECRHSILARGIVERCQLYLFAEFRTYLSTSAPLLYGVKTLSIEIDMRMLAIKALAVLALALVAIATSSAREDNQCYSSCKARCVARYACEGRHPGPNCFTNFNKCRTSCWRMCRHLSGFSPKAG